MSTGLALETDVSRALRSCFSFSYGLSVSGRSAAVCKEQKDMRGLMSAATVIKCPKNPVEIASAAVEVKLFVGDIADFHTLPCSFKPVAILAQAIGSSAVSAQGRMV